MVRTRRVNPDCLTAKEAAELLSRDVKTIRRWVASGYLPARKAPGRNGSLMFSRLVIEEWLRNE